MADPLRCGKCKYCDPKPCGKCAACAVKPSRCYQMKTLREKPEPCVHHDKLKKKHDADEAKMVEEREKRRTEVAERRRRAAAAPAPAKNPNRVAGGVKAGETRRENQASEPVDGRGGRGGRADKGAKYLPSKAVPCRSAPTPSRRRAPSRAEPRTGGELVGCSDFVRARPAPGAVLGHQRQSVPIRTLTGQLANGYRSHEAARVIVTS